MTPSTSASSSPRSTVRGVRSSCDMSAIHRRREVSSCCKPSAMRLTLRMASPISSVRRVLSRVPKAPCAICAVAVSISIRGRTQWPAIQRAISNATTSKTPDTTRMLWYCEVRKRASTSSGTGLSLRIRTIATCLPCTYTGHSRKAPASLGSDVPNRG